MTQEKAAAPRAAGDKIVDFTLRATDGNEYSSASARRNGLLLTVFFKIGCGTCKFSVPYLQRFHTQYAMSSEGRFQIWGVSQDNAQDTLAFAQKQGPATFPLLLDQDLEVTESYRLIAVPDLFLMGAADTIEDAVTGYFSKDGFNDLARRVAAFLEVPYTPIVREEDDAPLLKPG
ncbi:MAG TPA: TlpA disulfide reductase family protein [Chthonomonadaceae bacterium]|nr:TlpA disulfide reductase family protein [Chthonomonadaceae bacterium]